MKKAIIIIILLCCIAQAQHIPYTAQQFNDETFTLWDDGDPTKRAMFELSGLTTGVTRTITLYDADGTPLYNIVEDTTPQLGGDLDGRFIYDVNHIVDINASGDIKAEHLKTTDDLEVADDIFMAGGNLYWDYDADIFSYVRHIPTGSRTRFYVRNAAGNNTEQILTLWNLKIQIDKPLFYSTTEIIGSDREINKSVVEDSGNWDDAYTHISNDGTDHSYIDQDLQVAASPTFSTLGIGTAPVANQALTILGGTTKGLKLTQGGDSKGIVVYGFDDRSDDWFDMAVDSYGRGYFSAKSSMLFMAQDGLLYFKAGADDIEMRVGDSVGSKKFYIEALDGTDVFYVFSDGETQILKNLKIGALSTPTEALDVTGDILVSDSITSGLYNFGADGEANDDYEITLDPAPAAYATGMMITFTANTANTGACDVNVNGLGDKPLKSLHDIEPPDNYIEAGSVVMAVYDGTNFQMIQPDCNP